VVQPTYSGLTQLDSLASGRRILPDLAERWEMPDDKTWRFHLRRDVKFHDGTPFSAVDAQFSLERIFTAPGTVPTPDVRIALEPVREVRVLSPYLLEIRTSRPWASALPTLSGWFLRIVPQHFFQKGYTLDEYVRGTGPFILRDDTYKRGEGGRLIRNKEYWDKELPYLDEIVITEIPDPQARLAAFAAGRVDLLLEPLSIKEGMSLREKLPRVKFWQYQDPLRGPDVILNTSMPPLNDIRVRKALRLAIDDRRVYAASGNPCHMALNSPLGLSSWGMAQEDLSQREEHAQTLAERQAEALRLVREANLTSGFSVQIMLPPDQTPGADLANAQELARLLQQMWQPITAYPESKKPRDISQLRELLVTQQFEAALTSSLFTTIPNPDGLALVWGSFGPKNYTGLSDSKLDGLLERQSMALDGNERLTLLHEAQRRILDSYAGFFLPIARPCAEGEGTPVQPWVQDYRPDWQGAALDNLRFDRAWIDRSMR